MFRPHPVRLGRKINWRIDVSRERRHPCRRVYVNGTAPAGMPTLPANTLFMKYPSSILNFTLAIPFLTALPVVAGNWPGWRGPEGTGVSSEKNLPLKWSTNQNVHWRIDLPDAGKSSAIESDERGLITQVVDDE